LAREALPGVYVAYFNWPRSSHALRRLEWFANFVLIMLGQQSFKDQIAPMFVTAHTDLH
jgi:hypothetical protein